MKLSEHNKVEGCKCKPVAMKNLAQTIDQADEMYNFMIKNNGAGLAAPQVGILKTFFVMKDWRGADYQLIINPRIWGKSEKQGTFEEGCLTYKGEYRFVKRPKQIKAEWTNEQGKRIFRKLTGQESQVFQHEEEHLEGVTIMNRDKNG